nr:hypothetical protein CFP56_02685 [Quercus suber]
MVSLVAASIDCPGWPKGRLTSEHARGCVAETRRIVRKRVNISERKREREFGSASADGRHWNSVAPRTRPVIHKISKRQALDTALKDWVVAAESRVGALIDGRVGSGRRDARAHSRRAIARSGARSAGAEGVVDLVGETATVTGGAVSAKETTAGAGAGAGGVPGAGARAFKVPIFTHKSALSSLVGLGDRVRHARQAGAFLGRSDTEHRRLPSITLGGEILVFRGLGGDATWQLNVFEHRVVLGDGDVNVLVFCLGLELFFLLLALLELALEAVEVSLVHVFEVFRVRVVLGLFLGAVGLGLDLVQEGVCLGDIGTNLLLRHLLNDLYG